MIILRNKEFSKKYEAYGDIDKNAPDDPNYERGINKWSKRAVGAGAGAVLLGAAVDSKKGHKALKEIAEHKDSIDSSKFFKKDHFGHEGSGDWFDKQLQGAKKRYTEKIAKHEKAIKEISSKNKGAIRRALAGSRLKAAGGVAAVGGGALYLGNKLVQNSRRTSKKDLKDVLTQAHKNEKTFARRDYEGLTASNAKLLQQRRSQLAKQLRLNAKFNKRDFKGEDLAAWNSVSRKEAQSEAKRYRKSLLDEQKLTEKFQKMRAVRESIAKHEAKANELRAKKAMFKNLKTAGKVGLGVAGAVGLGYGIKKAIDKNKDKEEL